jgi:hypothetical protein
MYPETFPSSSATMKVSGKPLVQIDKKEIGVVFWEADAVDLHYALKVVWNEFSQRKGLLHCFAF